LDSSIKCNRIVPADEHENETQVGISSLL
jgi:hypothetical protein